MSAANWPTFQDFTFDLSSRLRQAAQRSLAELEASINCDGHDWLDDYIDNIEAQGRKAPIADLIKTPSRTQTAKKTRAVLTASKNRVEQIRLFNERAALSPLTSNSPNVRQPFSPLSTHRLNTIPASPTPASPLKGKALPLIKAKKEKAVKEKVVKEKAPKAKKGKKQSPDEASSKENAMEVEPTASSASATKSTGIRGVALQAPAITVEPPPTKATPVEAKATRKPSPVKAKEPTPEPMPEPEEKEVVVVEEEDDHEGAMEVDPPAADMTTVIQPTPASEHDEPLEEPIDVDEDVEPPIAVDEAVDIEEDVEIDVVEEPALDEAEDEPIAVTEPEPAVRVAADPAAPTSPAKAISPVKAFVNETSPFKVATAEPVSAKLSSPEKTSSPVKEAAAPAPAVPVRQVRSSWLSSALGTRTVPVSGLGADRKSYASGSQPRGSIQYESLRKSVAAAGTLKRKSEDGPEVDEPEVQDRSKEKRADKVARFEPSTQSTSPVRQPELQAARTPASAPQAKINALGDAPTSVPSASSAPLDGRHRPDTYKVARALDEMRERAAAAAAKQKAAAAAAATTAATSTKPGEAARPVPTATSTGTGFLRGLGNLGVGFLGLGSSEADEARLRREEEDRRAQEEAEAELARIMRDMAEEDKKAAAEAAAAIALTAASSKPMTQVRKETVTVAKANNAAILSEDEEDAINDFISLPELPQPDIGDDFDAIPLDDGVTSALGAAGIDIDIDFPDSTTPPNSPPRRIVPVYGIPRSPAPATAAPKAEGKQVLKVPEVVISPPRAKTPAVARPIRTKQPKASVSRPGTAASTYEDADDENDDELPTTMKKTPGMHRSRLLSNASVAGSTLGVSTKSSASTLLSQADRMAAKALGIKPTPGNVKSIQAAAAAKKKEQEQTDRKAELREKIEQRRLEEKQRKEAEEKARLEEERKQRLAEEEDKRRRRAEADQRRKEREEKMERLAKEKAAREEREAATARAKQAEEEAARKRKMAPLINKNMGASTIKRVVPPAAATAPKKDLASSKSTSNLHAQSKMGPTAFRTNEEPARVPTISLVVPPAPAAQAERRPLGPPARTSTAQGPHGNHAAHAGPSNAAVLQQSRAALQAQLGQKAIDMESEAIELPDIASEYSDSDDSEKEDDFKRPGWAGTPELRNALKAQASINPDDLFGPIRPLNMEELFNARQGKFRARTSSANWSGADRLTEQEEREYARRMGFRPINAPRESRPSGSNR